MALPDSTPAITPAPITPAPIMPAPITPAAAPGAQPANDTRMPAVFFGHGSPMNALETNRYTEAWATFGATIAVPRAIVVISAHWYINATAVTAMPAPRTIHDFYGFPQELFDTQYPAPGSAALAEQVADLVSPTWVGMDTDSWGLDHGTWSVLKHVYPRADIPVVQLAINAEKPLEYHVELGAQLSALRDDGVLVVGSGNVVHNLGRLDWSQPEAAFDWAQRFDESAKALLRTNPAEAPSLSDHRDFRAAVPTPDHFIPMLYIAGIASASNDVADVLIDGYAMGSLSMTSYTVGLAA